MPAPRRSAKSKEPKNNGRVERLGGGMSDYALRRSDAFGHAMNRKGMPMTWGTGVLRTDDAWKRDEEYRQEDARAARAKRKEG